MPELAEVEFYRKQWDPGIGRKVREVAWNSGSRVFRGCDGNLLAERLRGARLVASEAHGKRLLFRFRSERDPRPLWLGLHLGMSGKLTCEAPGRRAGRHEHLLLDQRETVLVFTDPRQFGRVEFATGTAAPPWWRDLPPAILSTGFTQAHFHTFLDRHRKASIKAVLLRQDGFPGLGNWMVDEILWRSGIRPSRPAGDLAPGERQRVFRAVRSVCRGALDTVGRDFRDPPAGWLFHRRWMKGGACPRSGAPLRYEAIAGRTTCWSPARQH